MGFEPLSEASLRALSLQARFMVALAEAKSLRGSGSSGGLGSLHCSSLADGTVT